jgi:hypothetical protein
MSNEAALANSSASVANSNSNSGTGNQPQSPAVALFQKAHAKMVTLQRVDEQLEALLTQRRKLQDELRCCQLQINEEFDRIMHAAREGEERFMSQYTDVPVAPTGNGRAPASRRSGGGKDKDPLRLEVADSEV